MEILNKKEDLEIYLQTGLLSTPFLDKEYVEQQVMLESNNRQQQGLSANKLESLYFWINKNVKFTKDDEYKAKHKFNRTAQEIWESKTVTGCADLALLFATFARQIGIPATILHTAEKGWLQSLLNGEKLKYNVGHCFCECFYNDEWVLVDPTAKRIEEKYDCDCIKLSYSLGGDSEFVPFYRCADINIRQNVRLYNRFMNNTCRELFCDVRPKIDD